MTVDVDVSAIPTDPAAAIGYEALYALWKENQQRDITTAEFRDRYLGIIRATAKPWLWPAQRETIKIVPAVLGDLSQAIGAALVALYQSRR